jgi:hypothetical protein
MTSSLLRDDCRPRPAGSLAKFFAGVPGYEESNHFHAYNSSEEWADYSNRVGELFGAFERKYCIPFSKWSRTLAGASDFDGAVFYPFSGPDFVFPNILFPNAAEYILCGREFCAEELDLNTLDGTSVLSLLNQTLHCAEHYFENSYFLTRDLGLVTAKEVGGVLPLILLLIVRSGFHVIDVRSAVTQPCAPPAVEIVFQGTRNRPKVTYFQQDLRDEHFINSGLGQHLTRAGDFAVFCKSASYLLHEPNFCELSELILRRCGTLVQDPSSLPFATLRKRGWDVDLFGSYTSTLEVFEKYEQADLATAYRMRPSAEPLGFGIGYLRHNACAALMTARPGTPPVDD